MQLHRISQWKVSLMFELLDAFTALSLRNACIIFILEKFRQIKPCHGGMQCSIQFCFERALTDNFGNAALVLCLFLRLKVKMNSCLLCSLWIENHGFHLQAWQSLAYVQTFWSQMEVNMRLVSCIHSYALPDLKIPSNAAVNHRKSSRRR
ncbi:uncharacterized protein LOC132631493 [Lycium barbarum]|uniref:uncharacterized protein LOC132631493 n=1 Tax=Lycium barbarum TaxID=112863 RepID=UPI00293F01CD|nr:uncharacterized protein LOC132631493 [Lycium barbarum]